MSGTQTTIERLATVGTIAHDLGVREHQVRHVIDSRDIAPASRAGAAYVYSPDAVARIGAELRAIGQRHAEGVTR
jgi:hypothetical protein